MKYLLVLLALLILPTHVLAQTSNDYQNRIQALQQQSQARAAELQKRLEEAKQRSESFQQKIEASREAKLQQLEQRKTEIKQRLENFKNKVKAQITERLNNNFSHVNKTITDTWVKQLDQMDRIIVRLEGILQKAKSEGKDINTSQASIDQAKATIANTRLSLAEQASKSYIITATSEARVAKEAKTVRDLLHKDLRSTHQLIKNTRDSVIKAIQSVKALYPDLSDNESTKTAKVATNSAKERD